MAEIRTYPSLRHHFKALADLLLPRACIVCGRRLNGKEEHLCLLCLADLPLTYFHLLSHNPMADRFNSLIPPGLEKNYIHAAALFFFDSEAEYRKIPYQIKYLGNISAGRFFGRLMGKLLKQSDAFKDVDAIIPVPLHWSRQWKRGYNQAKVIASGIAEELKVKEYDDILKRNRRTRTQTQLSIEEKTRNVTGAFDIRCKTSDIGHIYQFRHILLVDDVFTTGSTLCACYTTLRGIFSTSVRISIASLGYVGQ